MNLRKNAIVAMGVLALGLAGAASAATDPAQLVAAAPAANAASMAMTAGEIRKVDVEQSKLTIKHDPITNLDMPAMTMVFRAEKPELLKDLKSGDKVRFHAESSGGALVVTHIEAAK